jgi:hypothetical protein
MTITPFGPDIVSLAGGTEQSPTNTPLLPSSVVTRLVSVSATMTVPNVAADDPRSGNRKSVVVSADKADVECG